MKTIDVNCDAGESPERLADGSDEALFGQVSSVNIACGGHAGDSQTMAATVRLAMRFGVAIGAHPSFPDREGFGRRSSTSSIAQIEAAVEDQLAALRGVVDRLGGTIRHLKPHGALYHAVSERPELAVAVARAGFRVVPGITLVAMAGSPALDLWHGLGYPVASEGFADRAYAPDGKLLARGVPGALILDPEQAARQALALADSGDPEVRTLCIHSDTPEAASIARAVRNRLQSHGFTIAAFGAG